MTPQRPEDIAPSSELPKLIAANAAYAAAFAKGGIPMPPARKLVIVTCMDARLDPARFLGLEEGDAHVLRNAGGLLTGDVLRSLLISYHIQGTREFVFVRHIDCGLLTLSNDRMRDLVRERTGVDAPAIDFLPFADLDTGVRDDMAAVRSSPLFPDAAVAGFVFDETTGRLREVT